MPLDVLGRTRATLMHSTTPLRHPPAILAPPPWPQRTRTRMRPCRRLARRQGDRGRAHALEATASTCARSAPRSSRLGNDTRRASVGPLKAAARRSPAAPRRERSRPSPPTTARADGRPAPASTPRRRGSWRRLERAAARRGRRAPAQRAGRRSPEPWGRTWGEEGGGARRGPLPAVGGAAAGASRCRAPRWGGGVWCGEVGVPFAPVPEPVSWLHGAQGDSFRVCLASFAVGVCVS
mmetsp:Transcript_18236/g.58140  ORF Transcript_18236/g.58140 Transcript_18236/m.58140 type:complete len:237 (+) Transcript_18236:2344-3054(+)